MTLEVVESSWVALPGVTESDAKALEALGRQFSTSPNAAEEADETTAIQCRRSPSGEWQVRVNERVGVIGTGERSWVVAPKIPMPHLLYLLAEGRILPQSGSVPTSLGVGNDFWRLMYWWLLDAAETVVRRDLVKGYVHRTAPLQYMRGSIDVVGLSRGMLQGKTAMTCHYEDFQVDIPPNRLLRAAIAQGLLGGRLDEITAGRARRLMARFEGVSQLSPGDLDFKADRQSMRYGMALDVAKSLLRCEHRQLSIGPKRAFCFLWRTPEMVEQGIRAVLGTALHGLTTVGKTPRTHGELSFNADLVFGDKAVGDVKYSLDSGKWRRSDVNQLLAFSVAYGSERALLVNFGEGFVPPASVAVETVELTRIRWDLSSSPEEAALALGLQVRAWAQST